MRKTLQAWLGLIFFLFLLPIIFDQIPNNRNELDELSEEKNNPKLVYAANLNEIELPTVVVNETKKALLYFTHPYEAFEPITESFDGKVAVSKHTVKNIMSMKDQIQAQFQLSGIQMDVLDVDNEVVMENTKKDYSKAYNTIRPYVQEKLNQQDYDIILDLHRDVLTSKQSTVSHNGEKYAKILFVIGQENVNYRWNEQLALRVSTEIEKLVPGISRGLMHKMGHGVDGVYNQDLSKQLLVIEMGGIKNTEDELNRSIAILSKAISNIIEETPESVDTAFVGN